jgi:succinate dehydrogenase hydrophobic anchor subunit
MVRTTLGKLESHAFFLLFIAFILTVFWYSMWGILDDMADYMKKKLGLTKHTIYIGMLGFVLIVVAIFPKMLERF